MGSGAPTAGAEDPRLRSSYFRRLGPGLVTGAADDDPSGIGTYAQVGAAQGTTLLWTAPALLPLAFVVQETCARLAIVTGSGLATLIRQRLPRPVLYVAVGAVTIANTFNIAADLSSMAAAVHMLVPIPAVVALFAFVMGITVTEILVPYRQYSRALRWLCLSLLAYVGVLIVAHVDWGEVLHSTLLPSMSFSRPVLAALLALAGTTISPYLFFWQAAEETEERTSSVPDLSRSHLRSMRGDVLAGMAAAVAVMFAIMATAATTLHVNGITTVTSAQEAASALEPLAGPFAELLFTLGLVGTGLLAVPVLAGSTAYAVSETVGWREGLSKPPRRAPAFYTVIAVSMLVALVINALGLNPLGFLFLAAILNGLAAPLLIIVLWWLARDSSLMGRWRSGRTSQTVLLITAVVMAALPVLWLLAQ